MKTSDPAFLEKDLTAWCIGWTLYHHDHLAPELRGVLEDLRRKLSPAQQTCDPSGRAAGDSPGLQPKKDQ